MTATKALAKDIGKRPACNSISISRATFYRACARDSVEAKQKAPGNPPLALSPEEHAHVLEVLHSPRFVDRAPHEIYATLLDENVYLCSIRTMYRILEKAGEVRERRKHVRRSHYQKPELLATQPNQVWSWDITKIKGPAKWTYYHLYVIMDIYSRYVVGWMIAPREQASLAKRLIEETCGKQGIVHDQLSVHADRGSSMKSKPVAFLLADLGVTKSHSRPYVSNDNPYSESQFKTLKYCPSFPERFGSIQDARHFCQSFFTWYNTEHRHTGIGLVTPEQFHYGLADKVVEDRKRTLLDAYYKHSNRFKGKIPRPADLPEAAWINKPIAANGDVNIP